MVILLAGWMASGAVMFAWCVSKEGMPAWEEALSLFLAAIIGGPVWWVIFYRALYLR